MAFQPFPTELGRRAFEQICGVCWAEWTKTQYGQMCRKNEFLQWLFDNAQNPQGARGTDWTLMGGYDDQWTSEESAVFARAHHYWVYRKPPYVHWGYYSDANPAPDAEVVWWDQQPEKMATFPKTFVTTTGERFPSAAVASALLSTR